MTVIECPHCGTVVSVPDAAGVRRGSTQVSGQERTWVLSVDGTVVHRCQSDDG